MSFIEAYLTKFRDCDICLLGLIATNTIVVNIPITTIAKRISNRVNPFLYTCFFA
jgi:hypothetical protein